MNPLQENVQFSVTQFAGLDAKLSSREGLLQDPEAYQALLENFAEAGGTTAEDLKAAAIQLLADAPEGALLPKEEEGDVESSAVLTARRLIVFLDGVGVGISSTGEVESSCSALDVTLPQRSKVPKLVSKYFDTLGKVKKNGAAEKPLIEDMPNGAYAFINRRPFTSRFLPLQEKGGNGPIEHISHPMFSSFTLTDDLLPSSAFSAITYSWVLIADYEILDMSHVPDGAFRFTPRKCLLDRLMIPRTSESSLGEIPMRNPNPCFGYRDVPCFSEEDCMNMTNGFEGLNPGDVILVKMTHPITFVADDPTATLFHATPGKFCPVVLPSEFGRYMMSMRELDVVKTRRAADPTMMDLSFHEELMLVHEARMFLSPIMVIQRPTHVTENCRDALDALIAEFEVVTSLAAKKEITDADVAAMLDHRAKVASFSLLRAVQDEALFEREEAAGVAAAFNPGDLSFVSPVRNELMLLLGKEHNILGLPAEEFGREFVKLEYGPDQDEHWRAMGIAFLDLVESVCAQTELIWPVLKAEYEHTKEFFTDSDLTEEEIRTALLMRMSEEGTRIVVNERSGKDPLSQMVFNYEAGAVMDMDTGEATIPAPFDPLDDEEESEAKRYLGVAKRMGVDLDILEAVSNGDTSRIAELIEQKRNAMYERNVAEKATSEALAVRENALAIANDEVLLQEFLSSKVLTDMRTHDAAHVLHAHDIVANCGGISSSLVLGSNVERAAELLVSPISVRGNTNYAAEARLNKLFMLPAAVGVAAAKASKARLLRYATWSEHGQIAMEESLFGIASADEKTIKEIPGLSHSKLGAQLVLLVQVAGIAVGKKANTIEEVLQLGWCDFVLGQPMRVKPVVLKRGPLERINRADGTNYFALTDRCAFMDSDLFTLGKDPKHFLHDGRVAYLIESNGAMILLKPANALSVWFGAFFGGHIFDTGRGDASNAAEWEGLKAFVFENIEEETGPMFTIDVDEEGRAKYSNPFRLDIGTLLQLFAWEDGVPFMLESDTEPDANPDSTPDAGCCSAE